MFKFMFVYVYRYCLLCLKLVQMNYQYYVIFITYLVYLARFQYDVLLTLHNSVLSVKLVRLSLLDLTCLTFRSIRLYNHTWKLCVLVHMAAMLQSE